MEWVERLNQSMNYIEEHLMGEIDYEQLGRLPVALLIIIRECLLIWRELLWQSISVEEKCHWQQLICKAGMKKH